MGKTAILLGLVACATRDSPVPPSWTILTDGETAALLSVWGADANGVWVVGGRSDLAGSATVLHYQDGWTRVDTGYPGVDLWWVFGLSADDIYFGGSGGTILRWRAGAFERMETPRTGTIFGIWGTRANDLWAVGDGGAAGGIVWHFDGTRWTEPPLPTGTPSRVFKVEGRASDDVWISCGDGSVMHWQGTNLERATTGVQAPLFSIVATPTRIVAVGGQSGAGQIVEHGAEWAVSPLQSPVAWRGATARGEVIYALGEYGLVATRDTAEWRIVEQRLTQTDFHAGWIDPQGALWAVGGDYERSPLTARGFLAYFGSAAIEEVTR